MTLKELFNKKRGAAVSYNCSEGIVVGYSRKHKSLIIEVIDGLGWKDLEDGDVIFSEKNENKWYLYVPIK